MKTTGNLGLKKPEGTDIVDINDLNGNMDILDTAVKAAQDHAADAVKHITATERSTWNAKASTTAATTAAAGLMSAGDKSKLDSVANGANNYTHPSTHPPGIIVQDASNRFVTDAEKNAWNAKETTGGAQAKADNALAAANGALANRTDQDLKTTSNVRFNNGNFNIVNASAGINAGSAEIGDLTITGGLSVEGDFSASNTPQQTTANITYYVRTDGNDTNTGLANTAGGAFKTIGRALSTVPQVANHNVTINVAAGTYAEAVVVSGFTGSGIIRITGDGVISTSRNVTSVEVVYCTLPVIITGFNATTTSGRGFGATYSVFAIFDKCQVLTSSSNEGFLLVGSKGIVMNSLASNRGNGVLAAYNSDVLVENCFGTLNTVGVQATSGATLKISGSHPAGVTQRFVQTGGTLSEAVINPWGDNTHGWRPASRAYAHGSTGQSLSAGAWSKAQFPQENVDNLGNYDPATSRFIVPQSGIYQINAAITFLNIPAGHVVQGAFYVNGVSYRRLGFFGNGAASATFSYTLDGSTSIYLNAGDYIEIYVQCTTNVTLSTGTDSNFEVVRVA